VDLNPLMNRIGSARAVLLGEATHGTSDFYRMRERISRELIIKKGFRFISIKADWPDVPYPCVLRGAVFDEQLRFSELDDAGGAATGPRASHGQRD
jgi:hypothetical protein